jgi:phospholipid/cholesterol/gamma-HCH transport system substrate-binding protein
MKRVLIPLSVLAVAAVVVLVTQPFGSSGYRVDAIFDTADGISSGMNVEVAGVPVGSVVGVKLTSDMKARLQLRVAQKFAPFHADASCQILPEGIISENYVQCDPGSSRSPALATSGTERPTVALTHDSTPVSLQQFIDIFSLPTADRLQLLINELGIATAGRGEDINAILRRANPSLTQANRVLATIDAQRSQLSDAITQTNSVITELAHRRGSVRQFVEEAASLSELTAAHRGPLASSIAKLPPLLSQVTSAADSLHRLSGGAVPLLNALQSDAPALTQLTSTIPQFTSAALPAVHSLSALAAAGRPALIQTRPLATELNRVATVATPAAKLLDELLANLQQRGGIEYYMGFIYALATAPSAFDAISHSLVLNAIVTPCYTDATAPGCNRGWTSQASRQQAGATAASASRSHPATARRARGSRPAASTAHGTSPAAGAEPTAPAPAGTGATATTTATPTPAPSTPPSSLTGLLDYLLK